MNKTPPIQTPKGPKNKRTAVIRVPVFKTNFPRPPWPKDTDMSTRPKTRRPSTPSESAMVFSAPPSKVSLEKDDSAFEFVGTKFSQGMIDALMAQCEALSAVLPEKGPHVAGSFPELRRLIIQLRASLSRFEEFDDPSERATVLAEMESLRAQLRQAEARAAELPNLQHQLAVGQPREHTEIVSELQQLTVLLRTAHAEAAELRERAEKAEAEVERLAADNIKNAAELVEIKGLLTVSQAAYSDLIGDEGDQRILEEVAEFLDGKAEIEVAKRTEGLEQQIKGYVYRRKLYWIASGVPIGATLFLLLRLLWS